MYFSNGLRVRQQRDKSKRRRQISRVLEFFEWFPCVHLNRNSVMCEDIGGDFAENVICRKKSEQSCYNNFVREGLFLEHVMIVPILEGSWPVFLPISWAWMPCGPASRIISGTCNASMAPSEPTMLYSGNVSPLVAGESEVQAQAHRECSLEEGRSPWSNGGDELSGSGYNQ